MMIQRTALIAAALATFTLFSMHAEQAAAQVRVGPQMSFSGIREVGLNATIGLTNLGDNMELHLSPSLVNHPESGETTNVINELRVELMLVYTGLSVVEPYAFGGTRGLMLQDSEQENGDPGELYYASDFRAGAGVTFAPECAFQPYLELDSDWTAIAGVMYEF